MKSLVFFFALFAPASLIAQSPKFDFDHKVQKFDKTKEGPVLSFIYPFTNSGDKPLVIQDMKVACTCTKFEFPKYPIMPGERDTIHVTFDTKGKMGWQDRTLEIISNAEGKNPVLSFKGVVDEKKNEE